MAPCGERLVRTWMIISKASDRATLLLLSMHFHIGCIAYFRYAINHNRIIYIHIFRHFLRPELYLAHGASIYLPPLLINMN